MPINPRRERVPGYTPPMGVPSKAPGVPVVASVAPERPIPPPETRTPRGGDPVGPMSGAELGERLARAFRRAGLSKGEVARRLGLDRARVAEWTNGRHAPTAMRLVWIASVLGLDLNTFKES